MDVKRLVNAEGVTDHTALLPTKNKSRIEFENLTENQRKVLELVYQNLEEATSKPFKYKKMKVTISYAGEKFTLTGRQYDDLGWKGKYRKDEVEPSLPDFYEGQKIAINEVFIEKHQTEPPDRFTDGKLLQAMEIAGKESAEQDVKRRRLRVSQIQYAVRRMCFFYG